MSRPDRVQLTRRTQVAELGESGGFSVVAPLLNTRRRSGAEGVADALKAALGIGTELFVQREDRRQRQMVEDFEAGERDARSGQLDADRRAASDGYARAAEQVEAEALTADDEAELTESAKQLVADGDVDGVRSLLKDEFAKRWSGLSDVQARVVVPWMAGLEARLTGEAQEAAKARVDAANRANILKAAEQEARDSVLEGRPFDHGKLHAYARTLFPAETNRVLTETLLPLVENQPEIADAMPDEWAPGVPSLKYTPGFRETLEAARERGLKKRDDEKAGERAIQQFKVRQTIDQRLEKRHFYSERELEDGVLTGLISNEMASSIRNRQYDLRERDAKEAAARAAAQQVRVNLHDAFDGGRWHGYLMGMSQDSINDEFDIYVSSAAARSPETATEFIMHASQKNGLVYRPLAAQLSRPNLEVPERFSQNVETFRQLYSRSPALARRYVADDSTFSLYTQAMTMQDFGRDPQKVLADANAADFSSRQKAWMEGDLRKDALARIGKLELDTRGVWFFQQEVADTRNRAWATEELRKITDALGQSGRFATTEELLDAAAKEFEGRYVIVDDVVIPRTASMPENVGEVWDWFHEDYAGRFLKARGLSLKASDVELRPDNRTGRDRETFRLYLRDSYEPVLPDESFTLTDIAAEWRAWMVEGAQNRRVTNDDQRRAITQQWSERRP